jgi:hypothetical protein
MAGDVQCWLVERTIRAEDVVTLVYATTDGERFHKRQLASNRVLRADVTAGRRVPAEELESVRDEADRARYAREATRMAEQHDPEDII